MTQLDEELENKAKAATLAFERERFEPDWLMRRAGFRDGYLSGYRAHATEEAGAKGERQGPGWVEAHGTPIPIPIGNGGTGCLLCDMTATVGPHEAGCDHARECAELIATAQASHSRVGMAMMFLSNPEPLQDADRDNYRDLGAALDKLAALLVRKTGQP